jgi:predicted dinucleotide-binding enzyme
MGERRVVFLSSDDQNAANKVAELVERLGFAPVWLGRLTCPSAREHLGSTDFSGSLQEGENSSMKIRKDR